MTFPIDMMAASAPTRLDPLELFLDADIVVQIVMVGLVLASIWTWTLIVSFALRVGGLDKKSRSYESEFWQTKDREGMLTKEVRADVPSARVAGAGIDEWKRSKAGGSIDKDAARDLVDRVKASTTPR